MTNDERQELVAAVREALGPFKDELKTELQVEVLEPMETRLRGEMGEMETRLCGEMGEMETRLRGEMGEMEARLSKRMDHLENEISSLTNDVVIPFIEAVHAQHEELVKQLDRLEKQVERNSVKINQIRMKVEQHERRLAYISDDIAAIRERLNSLELRLSGEITYSIAGVEMMVAEERSVYEMIRELEKRVAYLEGRLE